MKKEKIYVVKFIEYTNCLHDTIYKPDKSDGFCEWNGQYLEIGKEPFLVKESDLKKYSKFGNGYKEIKFVGNIEVVENKENERKNGY